jgi:hypothetical protein
MEKMKWLANDDFKIFYKYKKERNKSFKQMFSFRGNNGNEDLDEVNSIEGISEFTKRLNEFMFSKQEEEEDVSLIGKVKKFLGVKTILKYLKSLRMSA